MKKQKQMPKYVCRKTIHALKIKRVDVNHNGNALLLIDDDGFDPIEVSKEYVDKHQPKQGGYYVVYCDGHKSFFPEYYLESSYDKIT